MLKKNTKNTLCIFTLCLYMCNNNKVDFNPKMLKEKAAD